MEDGTSPTLHPAVLVDIETYVSYLDEVKRRSPETIRSYRAAVRQALQLFAALGTTHHDCTREHVAAWMGSMRGHEDATVHQRVNALRSLFEWMNTTGIRDDDPTRGLRLPRCMGKLKPVPSEADVATVLEAHPETIAGVRDRAIFSLLYGCGLRVCEVRGITLADLDMRTRRVHVIGKGGVERNVPIPDGTIADVDAWLELRPRTPLAESSVLFPGRRPDGTRGQEAIWYKVRSIAKRSGVSRPGRFHPHLLRHAFAVHMLRGGCDLRALQLLLGHANIETTMRYLGIEIDELQQHVDSCHPLGTKPTRGRQWVASNPWRSAG